MENLTKSKLSLPMIGLFTFRTLQGQDECMPVGPQAGGTAALYWVMALLAVPCASASRAAFRHKLGISEIPPKMRRTCSADCLQANLSLPQFPSAHPSIPISTHFARHRPSAPGSARPSHSCGWRRPACDQPDSRAALGANHAGHSLRPEGRSEPGSLQRQVLVASPLSRQHLRLGAPTAADTPPLSPLQAPPAGAGGDQQAAAAAAPPAGRHHLLGR